MLEVSKKILESGYSLEYLSKKTNIPQERLSQIIMGVDFSMTEMLALTHALKISPNDLLQKDDNHRKAEVLFRNVTPPSKRENPEIAIQRLSAHISNSRQLLEKNNDPLAWLNDFNITQHTYEQAEFAAHQFRNQFYRRDLVSPIASLPAICTNLLNILLFVVEEKIDGASAIYGEQAYIFLANRSFRPRMLFTLAHELGHLVAGHHDKDEVASFDRFKQTDGIKHNKKEIELFADAFASCLLLPPNGVAIALKKIKEMGNTVEKPIGDVELLYLSRIFSVSFEAAARRCEDLQLLPSGGAIALYNYLNAEFGSPEKRADELGLPPRTTISFPHVPPTLIEQALHQVNIGELSIGKAAGMLSLSIPDLYSYNADGITKH